MAAIWANVRDGLGKREGFSALKIEPVGFEMEGMWVLGCAFDVIDWQSVGYGRVVVDIEGNLKNWRGDRRRSWYILEGCQQVCCNLWMHVVGYI